MLVAIAMFLFAFTSVAQQTRTPGTTHIVTIKQMRFNPSQLTVNEGDSVEWRNEDLYSHTATSDTGLFDSGLIDPGHSWQTTIKTSGTLAYHCRPHPNMVASVVVSGGGSGQPLNPVSLAWKPPHEPHEIHPILVNFTAALLPLALLSDVLGRAFRRKSLHSAAAWMMVYEAAISPLTVAAGWWWRSALGSANLPARLITVHQWLGTIAAALFIGLALWRWTFHKRNVAPDARYLIAVTVAFLALVFQGNIGGMMLFGSH